MEEENAVNTLTAEFDESEIKVFSDVGGEGDDDLDEPRGQKRSLDSNNEEPINNREQGLPDVSTITKGLPPGIVVSWHDNRNAIATFSSLAEAETDSTMQLCLIGRARVRCLEGKAEILGHQLLPGRPEILIGSPFWSSWMTIHVPMTTGEGSTAAKIQISSIRGSPSFRLVPPNRPVVIPPSWKSSVDQICQDFVSAPPPFRGSLEDDTFHHPNNQVVMICGAKGVGKSTFLRYLNNRLLQSYPKDHLGTVAILDADVGQPELAPPGMLRLCLQRGPLLYPPHWNLCDLVEEPVEQISAVYYGAVTSKVDPTRYIDCVQRLLHDYRMLLSQSASTIPLIINLDGWIKGMGFEILSSLISTTIPSHVCQLLGESKGKTFDLSQVVPPQQCDGENIATISAIQLFFLDICNKHVTPVTIPSSTLRTIRLATYFGPHLVHLWDTLDFISAKQLQTGWSGDDDSTLAHYLAQDRPYCVPMEAVHCIHANVTITEEWEPQQQENQLLQSFNGGIVGLCTVSEQDCLGLGIVRSIDWKNRLLYILTPVPQNQLSKVTTLVGGNIPLPLPFIFRGVFAESFPYLTTLETNTTSSTMDGDDTNAVILKNHKILGSEPMKSRNNIGRRNFTGGGGGPPGR